MARVLVVYATTEGQTAKIAEHIADAGRAAGHEVLVRRADDVEDAELSGFEAFVVGASLHAGRYQREARTFVERNVELLGARPSAFFSVSLAAASRNADEREDVERLIARFLEDTHWTPKLTGSFAGALKYTRYGWLKRALMRRIARKEGGDVDSSRDFEYTDWAQVTRFSERFFGAL
ncbi:MAG TPA: menaquinone-dependent protoporphyrinogen IX dehydrogenase [Gammaproteobacteria bacterium]|nr:menaquinone-dependent protoporphyrinogen IX dehydrogenase [Gammaproteobacteria bacterium]